MSKRSVAYELVSRSIAIAVDSKYPPEEKIAYIRKVLGMVTIDGRPLLVSEDPYLLNWLKHGPDVLISVLHEAIKEALVVEIALPIDKREKMELAHSSALMMDNTPKSFGWWAIIWWGLPDGYSTRERFGPANTPEDALELFLLRWTE